VRLTNKVLILLISFSPSFSFAGDWKVHASELRAKIATVQQLEEKIEDLVKQKNTKAGNTAGILEQIVSSHDELKKAVKEYNKLRNHVRFEHPEQGDDTERKYRPHRFKSIEEFEEAVGIYGKLDRLKRKVKTTYGIEDPKPPEPPKPKKKEEDLDTEVPRVKLSY
jgi:hypothetical protein